MVRRLLCIFGIHRRERGAPAWDGERYRSHCRYCGNRLERASGARWTKSRKHA